MTPAQQRYMHRAKQALSAATSDDFLSFLTVRRFAGGSATARFYDAFPVNDGESGGRQALIDALKRDATILSSGTDPSTEVVLKLMELVRGLKGREPEAAEQLKEVALYDFESWSEDEEEARRENLRLVLMASARADAEAKDLVRQHYASIERDYTNIYDILLDTVGREPLDALGSTASFTKIVMALVDGLLLRARFETDAKHLLLSVLIPIINALSKPKGTPDPEEAELLYG